MNDTPPFENWIITGEFTAAAASITELTVSVPVQFTAGIAKPFSLARANISPNVAPVATPDLIFWLIVFMFINI